MPDSTPSGRADARGLGAIGRSARSGVAWSTFSFAASKLITLLSTLVLARLLVPAQFGVVAAVLVFLALIELGSDLGMKATVIYEQEGSVTERTQTAFTMNLIIAGGLSAAGILIAPAVAGFFHLEHHIALFRLGILNVFLVGLGNVQDGLLLRDMRWRARVISEVVRTLVRAAVSIGLAVAGLGAASLVWGMIAGTLAWVVLLWSMTGMRPALRLDRSIARSMLGYGAATSALSIIAAVSTRVDATAIARVLGDRALGLYTVAFRVPDLVIGQVASNLSLVAFPALVRKRVADEEGLSAAMLRLMRYQTVYVVPLAAGIAVLAPSLTYALFGSKWLDSAGVLEPVAVFAAFYASAFPLGDAFKAVGRQRVLVFLNFIQLPLLITTVILVAPAGIVAVGWARAGSAALWATLVSFAVTRLLKIPALRMLAAFGPGVAAGLGVLVGGGAVRLLWGGHSVGALLVGIAAASVGGVASLRALAPGTYRELKGQLGELLSRKRARPAAGAPPSEVVLPRPRAADQIAGKAR